jgi:hypothetical protein
MVFHNRGPAALLPSGAAPHLILPRHPACISLSNGVKRANSETAGGGRAVRRGQADDRTGRMGVFRSPVGFFCAGQSGKGAETVVGVALFWMSSLA